MSSLTKTYILLLSICIGLVGVQTPVHSDPYSYNIVPPDEYTYPPKIAIVGFNQTYKTQNIQLNVEIELGTSSTAKSVYLADLYFVTDWSGRTSSKESFINKSSYQFDLTGVPEGNHSITVYAVERGVYGFNSPLALYDAFQIMVSKSVNFTVSVPLGISLELPENKTYFSSVIPLNFTLTKTSNVSYSLDGQPNRTIAGNTTLEGLTYGTHTIAVYANDSFGNNKSETVTFAVEESFQTISVIAIVSVAAIVTLGISMLYIRSHRKTVNLAK